MESGHQYWQLDEQEKRIMNDSGMTKVQKQRCIISRRLSFEKKRKRGSLMSQSSSGSEQPSFNPEFDEDHPSEPAILGGEKRPLCPADRTVFSDPPCISGRRDDDDDD